MGYGNLPGVKANYIDGAFFNQPGSGQPRIVILGVAEMGDSYKLFRVFNQNEATREFGSGGEMIRRMYEVFEQGADNVYLMRIGGTTSELVITDSAAGTLTVSTTQTGDDAGERFALFLQSQDNDGTKEQRVLIYDSKDTAWVYDSHELAVVNDGSFTVVLDSWDSVFEVGVDSNGNADSSTEADYLIFDAWGAFNSATSGTLELAATSLFTASNATGETISNALSATTSGKLTKGDDGLDSNGVCTMSKAKLYIALEKAYSILDFQYADFVIPTDVYLDDPNITDLDDGSDPAANTGTALYTPNWTSMPTANDGVNDVLGYFWKYRKGSRTYYTMSTVKDLNAQPLTGSFDITDGSANTVTVTGLVTDSTIAGSAADPISIDVVSAAPVDGTWNSGTRTLTIDIPSSAPASADIQAALQGLGTTITGFNFTNVVVPAGITNIAQTGASAGTLTIAQYYLSYEQLTGKTITTKAAAALAAATATQFREINFAHQLASFCDTASTNWKTLIGVISTSMRAPKDSDEISGGEEYLLTDQDQITEWAGASPTYVTIGGRLALDNIEDNGNGILGNKFMAGAVGYRWRELDGGTISDGLAYGGFTLTKGLSLPNSGEPYGIDQSDEAKDAQGFPIDLGKYIVIASAWPRLTTSASTISYRAPITGMIAGRLSTLPEYQLPIGPVNGAIASGVGFWNMNGLSSHIANNLLQARYTTLGSRTPGTSVNYYFAGVRTAAHPDSDYTRVSTIRCVNRVLQGIRDIGEQYIGNSFTSLNLISLQTALNGYLKAEETEGIHQGAAFQLSYTRAERIMGRLNVKLKMIPPFSIEAIVVDVTLAADESGLS